MIKDENRRRMFLFVTLEGDLRKYAKESCQDYYYIQRQFKLLTREIQARIGFLRTYKEDMIKLKAILRLYEKNFGKNLFNTELMQERSALAQERKKLSNYSTLLYATLDSIQDLKMCWLKTD